MKAHKAIRRLEKISALITDVSDRYTAANPDISAMLQAAQTAVTSASKAIGSEPPTPKKARPSTKKSTAVKKANKKK